MRGGAFVKNDDGTAAIEFALILPIFILILLGILGYGIYFGAAQSAAQLAADAARASIAGLSDTERTSIARQHVANYAGSYAMLLDSTKITVEAAAVPGDATEFRVTVRYNAADLPIFSFAPFLPVPSQSIVQTAVVKRGGY